ncbi:hypothetical protein D3C80_1248360 [compost metagenome]
MTGLPSSCCSGLTVIWLLAAGISLRSASTLAGSLMTPFTSNAMSPMSLTMLWNPVSCRAFLTLVTPRLRLAASSTF